ncbi:hypothetical protein KAK07_23285 [Ideonella sp. 4Y16]|uniref:hypothetical protein n=1 Tax=Ideonella alba TaxID=2824118 RepID=UPI001B37DAF4|nr:hypothetical protein [Ideonella alba]MBQ0946283.1 hypothetical protein [Ideonella alba]
MTLRPITLAAFVLAAVSTAAFAAAPGRAKVYTAVVAADGIFSRGSTGATSALIAAPSSYQVSFVDKDGLPVDVRGCTYNATLGTTSTGVNPPGVATTAQRTTATNAVFVRTFDMTASPVASSFHLQVACP